MLIILDVLCIACLVLNTVLIIKNGIFYKSLDAQIKDIEERLNVLSAH